MFSCQLLENFYLGPPVYILDNELPHILLLLFVLELREKEMRDNFQFYEKVLSANFLLKSKIRSNHLIKTFSTIENWKSFL